MAEKIKRDSIKKIVVLGPESTGKSALCQQLAHHYQTIWCPEYAREYLSRHGTTYNYNHLLTIAKGQVALEEEFINKVSNNNIGGFGSALHDERKENVAAGKQTQSKLLFIDTDQYVMKVWCEFVFGKCHPYILDQIATRKYDLYLLCDVDMPWTKDDLREYPELEKRQQLFTIYRQLMQQQTVPWATISGLNEQRFQNAVAVVDAAINARY